MAIEVILFPAEVIALNQELATGYHEVLALKLQEHQGSGELLERLAIIATHCGVVVDGMYDGEDIIDLCGLLRDKLIPLRESRSKGMLILDSSGSQFIQ
jgi:hypothetical protein